MEAVKIHFSVLKHYCFDPSIVSFQRYLQIGFLINTILSYTGTIMAKEVFLGPYIIFNIVRLNIIRL